MSVIKSVSLACDHSECADSDSFEASQGVFDTATAIRQEAKAQGWTVGRGGKDYCPDHSGSTEEAVRRFTAPGLHDLDDVAAEFGVDLTDTGEARGV
jgi:hypothetical protein